MKILLELLIIGVIIAVTVLKNRKKPQPGSLNNRPNKPIDKNVYQKNTEGAVEKAYPMWRKESKDYDTKAYQQELKRRLSQKYEEKRQSTSTVAELSPQQNPEEMPAMTEAPLGKEILQRADTLADVDLNKIYDIPQMHENSALMNMVEDILAKGFSAEIAFERDFVAEGLDMINNTTS